jgi:hypothetical protein
VEFVVDKLALGSFFSEYFGFSPASHHSIIHIHSITAP